MPEIIDHVFYNQPRRIVRLFWKLTLIFIVVGLLGLYVTSRTGRLQGDNWTALQTVSVLAAAIFLPSSISMILAALLTIPSARRADRAFAGFRDGKFLVHWKYSDDQWEEFAASEWRRLRYAAMWLFILIFATAAVIAIAIVFSMGALGARRIELIALGVAIAAAIGMLPPALVLAYAASRVRRLRSCTESFIGPRDAYCGGDYVFWGTAMRALNSIRFVPGDKAHIALSIGLGSNAQSVLSVVDFVNLASQHVTMASQYKVLLQIPVPTGREAEAAHVVNAIIQSLQPPAKAPAPVRASAPVPHVPIAHASLPAHAAPAGTNVIFDPLPPRPPSRAGLWWKITGILIALGVLLFSWAVVLNIRVPEGKSHENVGAVPGALGFFLVVLAVIPGIVAVILTISDHRRRTSDAQHIS